MGMAKQKNNTRNRDIFAANQNGETIAELAQRYRLSEITVMQIIMIERHKAAVSVDAFYKQMRSRK